MLMSSQMQQWSPAAHQHWPPEFKAAVPTLLLAARRGATVQRQQDGMHAGRRTTPSRDAQKAAEQQPNLLSLVPPEFLMDVIRLAAFPLSAWVPQ